MVNARGSSVTLGNLRRSTNHDLNFDTSMTEHRNQCVNAESIDLAPNLTSFVPG